MPSQYFIEYKNRLLQVARKSLTIFLKNGKKPVFETEITEFLKKLAVFVTLRKKYSLDLCSRMGQTEARYPLIKAISITAISSAVDDLRFPPVIHEELPKLSIEINVLTELTAIEPQDVVEGKHGLQLRIGLSRGLYLPEVPLSQAWDRITFLDQLCTKADLPLGSWQDPDVELFCFESESWEES